MPQRLGVDRFLYAGELRAGDVALDDGRIVELDLPSAGTGRIAAPGFVDLQINGFAGVDFASASESDYARVAQALAATGVTAFQPTLVSLPRTAYAPALATAGAARQSIPEVIGVHLEGPFITRQGAHNPDNLVPIDLDWLVELSRPPTTWMTIAPELAGALTAIDVLRNAGCVVAVGHSNAASEDAAAAFHAGASSVTHIFNAQTGWDHRNPGLAAAALADPDALLTLIVDGHHLSDDTVRALFQSAAHRCALITDAIAAAGEGDGTSDLGDRQVHVDGGRATLSDGTLAGAVATMDAAVRNVHGLGIDLAAALSAASEVPGRAVVGADLGTIREGAPADLVVLDDRLDVHLTMKGGHETYTA